MRLYEFAKVHGRTSKQVSAAAVVIGLNSSHSSSTITEEEASQLLLYFANHDPNQNTRPDGGTVHDKTSTPAGTQETAASPGLKPDVSLFDGSPFHPPFLYKFAKRRRLTLDQAIAGCAAIGLTNNHRHRNLHPADIEQLDQHFRVLFHPE